MIPISPNVFLFRDTCNVYIVRSGHDTVLIDFGSGAVLDALTELGIDHVHAILMTHHHRDQGQGLPRAVAAGIPIWVPHAEQDLFAHVDAHWQAREIYNNYNSRQDRFSLLEPVPIAGTLEDYAAYTFGTQIFSVIPTPGHTIGSITLMIDADEQRFAFTGDLIAAPGQAWSIAATQWTYNGVQGVAASILSLLDLKDRQPTLLLPSHGDPMPDPGAAVDLLVERFWALLQLRGQFRRLKEIRLKPYEAITPHLLRHRQSFANHYVLLSERGTALMIDFGYEVDTGVPAGYDRASRRPTLYSLPALKQQFGVSRVDVIIPTHFHDDHVAGINLLRRVEGTKVWCADSFADIFENPSAYDLPCLWYDPIPVDRRLPLETTFQWEEYTITLYPLPGHTRYAVAIAFEVDGWRVIAGGDQYQGESEPDPNYVYPNRFDANDYAASAELYRLLNPDLIITGHWMPIRTTPDYFDRLDALGDELRRLHRELLPAVPYLGPEDFLARLTPYQAVAVEQNPIRFTAEVHNPYARAVDCVIGVVTPPGWALQESSVEMNQEDARLTLRLDPAQTHFVTFSLVPPPGFQARRARIALDLTFDGHPFGQHAEALITAIE